MEPTRIFTDGAAKGNPGPGGFGAVIREGALVYEIGGGVQRTTNNEMELRAVVEALRALQDPNAPILIYTDSKYVRDGAERWVFGWQKNGWKTKINSEVRNRKWWEALLTLLPGTQITWHIVPGHSGVPGNERADAIASGFGSGAHPALYRGTAEGYAHDLDDTSYDTAKKDARRDARARGAQKAYSYVSLRDGVIETHATWAECEARVKGRKNVRFKKALNALEEKHIIDDFRRVK
jgi:ribonuclease HI